MYSTSRDKTSLTDIIECFETSSKKAGLPVLLKKEKINAGVLWNKTLDECLVVIHPTHQDDYFSIVLKISRQGNYDFHRIYLKGKSVLFKSSSELQSYMSGRNIILDYKYKPFDPISWMKTVSASKRPTGNLNAAASVGMAGMTEATAKSGGMNGKSCRTPLWKRRAGRNALTCDLLSGKGSSWLPPSTWAQPLLLWRRKASTRSLAITIGL